MSKKLYDLLFLIFLSLNLLGGFYCLYYALTVMGKAENNSDNYLFLFCFIIEIILNGFEIYSVIRSMVTGEEHFIKNLLYDDKNIFSRNFYIFLNILIVFMFAGLAYDIMIFNIKTLLFYDFPILLKVLICIFFSLVLIDLIFIDLYPLTVKKKTSSFERLK